MNLSNFESYTLLHSIASRIYTNSAAKSQKFSLMAAIHVIGSVAQLAWSSPDGIVTSMYQMFGAPSAFGKDFYFKAVEKYTRAVDESLIGNDPGSAQGFVSELISWNTASFLIDEFHVWYNDMMKNPGRKPLVQNILKLYNGAEVLTGTQLKLSRSPAIYSPRVSVLGVATLFGLAEMMTPEMMSGGLMGRFLIWWELEAEESYRTRGKVEPDPFEIDWLKKIYMPSNERNIELTKDGNLEAYSKSHKQSYKHKSVYPHRHYIHFSAEAETTLDSLYNVQKGVVRGELKEYFERDGDTTGTIGRIVFMTTKLAMILALSRSYEESPVVSADDVLLADKIMKCNKEGVDFILSKRHNSDYQKHKNRFIEFFNKRPHANITKHELGKRLMRDVDPNMSHKILLSLYDEGFLQVFAPDGTSLTEAEIRFRFPRGTIFRSQSF